MHRHLTCPYPVTGLCDSDQALLVSYIGWWPSVCSREYEPRQLLKNHPQQLLFRIHWGHTGMIWQSIFQHYEIEMICMWLLSLLTSEVRHAEKPAIHERNKPVMLQSIANGDLLLAMGLLARSEWYWATGSGWAGLEDMLTNQIWWKRTTGQCTPWGRPWQSPANAVVNTNETVVFPCSLKLPGNRSNST